MVTRILILGGSGMLGHKLWQVLSRDFETHITFRNARQHYEQFGIFDSNYTHGYISAENIDDIIRLIGKVRPDVVINCIGIVKQQPTAREIRRIILVNSLFPHRLSEICLATDARLIQISTDCVFSGKQGNYTEEDVADPVDAYGRTKLLGEVFDEGCLTIRTSMIGRELENARGLLGWFFEQEGKTINGYTQAIFNGFTTLAFSQIMAKLIQEHLDLSGIWHVSSDPISKYDLLMLVKEIYKFNVQIEPYTDFVLDRSLNS